MSRHSRVRFHGPDPIEGAEHLDSIGVTYVPIDFPQLRITWEYVLQGNEVLYPCGMRVEPWPGTPVEDRVHVGASFVRDLPLAKLERAARIAVELRRSGPRTAEQLRGLAESTDEDIPANARAMVRERWPDLDPEAGAGAARRWNRLVRLAEVVQEHQAARARGEKAPAVAVAEARGVASSTVRSWLFQAKEEGIVPPPMSPWTFVDEVISNVSPDAEFWED